MSTQTRGEENIFCENTNNGGEVYFMIQQAEQIPINNIEIMYQQIKDINISSFFSYLFFLLFLFGCNLQIKNKVNLPHRLLEKNLQQVTKLSKKEIKFLSSEILSLQDSIDDFRDLIFLRLFLLNSNDNGIFFTKNGYTLFYCDFINRKTIIYKISPNDSYYKIFREIKLLNIEELRRYAKEKSKQCSHCGIMSIIYWGGQKYQEVIINEFL